MNPSAYPLPPDQVLTDLESRAAYSEGAGAFRIVPEAVALPRSVADLAALVIWASGPDGMPLIMRGAGSGMAGGNVGSGIVADLTGMDGGVTIDAAARSARTGVACTVDGLNQAAGRAGLRMPAVPSSGRFATVGGVVATNAAGARSCAYGSVREWVRGVTLLAHGGEEVALDRGVPLDGTSALGRRWEAVAGEIAAARDLVTATFPRTRKNSAGYALDAYLESGDIVDLVIGSEGTLGAITEVRWALQPIPSQRRTLRIALRSLGDLDAVVATIAACGPTAVELLDRTFLAFVEAAGMDAEAAALLHADAVLIVEFEGESEDPLEDIVTQLGEVLDPYAAEVRLASTTAEADALWDIRHAASPILANLSDARRSLQVVEDGAVPPERLGEYVLGVRQITAAYGVQAVLFGHAGDGHVHVNLLPDVSRSGWQRAIRSVFEEVADLVFRLGGTPSGEHGDGRLRAPLLSRMYGAPMMRLFETVRAAFDPDRIFNPGVILPTGPIWNQLKVGPDAAPIPESVAEGLRTIERTGGYGIVRTALVNAPPRPRRTRIPDPD